MGGLVRVKLSAGRGPRQTPLLTTTLLALETLALGPLQALRPAPGRLGRPPSLRPRTCAWSGPSGGPCGPRSGDKLHARGYPFCHVFPTGRSRGGSKDRVCSCCQLLLLLPAAASAACCCSCCPLLLLLPAAAPAALCCSCCPLLLAKHPRLPSAAPRRTWLRCAAPRRAWLRCTAQRHAMVGFSPEVKGSMSCNPSGGLILVRVG